MSEEHRDEEVDGGGVTVPQARLDRWRAYAEQMRVDILTVRRLIGRGEGTAAAQILGGMLDSTLLAGVMLDEAGAHRPGARRLRPTGGAPAEAEREGDE